MYLHSVEAGLDNASTLSVEGRQNYVSVLSVEGD